MTSSNTPNPSIEPLVAGMVQAQSTEEVWQLYVGAMIGLGWDKLLYGGTRVPTAEGRITDLRDAMILQNGPQAYADVYLGEELYLHSPSYNWAADNTGFTSWAQAAQSFRGQPRPEHLKILQLNAQYGIKAGYVGSLNDTVRGMHGVIGISSADLLDYEGTEALWARTGAQVEMLSNLLQLRIASLPMAGTRRPLTTRQREALMWFAQGKTMRDIGVIMDLSPATVEKHLRSARDALDATTTTHAVTKATTLNLLSA
ncbi:MAG: autoinducer binding domain-containing protein [Pseudomonadota bacterium]